MRPRYLGIILAATLAGGLSPEAAHAAEPTAPASAMKAAQLVDISPDHWAYQAVEAMVDKYRIMGGFPDKTFRGQKLLNRYEIAVMLTSLINRLEQLEDRGTPAPAPDTKMADRLKDEFKVELQNLHSRLVAVETATGSAAIAQELADIKSKMQIADKLHGSISVSFQDDWEDTLKPYVVTDFTVKFGSDLDANTSYSASIGGGTKGNESGGTPVFTRGKDTKNQGFPDTLGKDGPSVMKLNSNAQITTKVPGFANATFKVGHISAGSFIGLGGLAHHYGDGLIGSGLSGPGGNTVRTGWWNGGEDIGVGAKIKTGAVGLGFGLNTKFVYGGLAYDLPGGLGDLHLIGDADHNSIGNVKISGDPNYHVAASANLGSDKLGVSLQGGLNIAGQKTFPKAGVNFIYALLGGELCAGATFKTDQDLTTMELIPTGYYFFPSKDWMPSILVGAKEPETLQSPKGATGPGSVMGTKAGWTVQLGIPNPIAPNLTFEVNMQSNYLGGYYDGIGYAFSTSTDF